MTTAIQPSVTLELSARAKSLQADHKPVLNLTAGEPDFDTPGPIVEAAHQALEAKEGLALINGTHLMAAIAALAMEDTRRLVDAAFCATAMAIDACRAGKDVYVEKPISLTIDEGKILRRVAQETGRVIQVGSWQRSDARYRLAVEMVRAGRIGRGLRRHSLVAVLPGRSVACSEVV